MKRMFNKDVLKDFVKDNQDSYDNLEKEDRKAVNKFINKHAAELITEYFK